MDYHWNCRGIVRSFQQVHTLYFISFISLNTVFYEASQKNLRLVDYRNEFIVVNRRIDDTKFSQQQFFYCTIPFEIMTIGFGLGQLYFFLFEVVNLNMQYIFSLNVNKRQLDLNSLLRCSDKDISTISFTCRLPQYSYSLNQCYKVTSRCFLNRNSQIPKTMRNYCILKMLTAIISKLTVVILRQRW